MQSTDGRYSTVVLQQHRDKVDELRAAWRAGAADPNAEESIKSLGGTDSLHKSIVLDLAFEEYSVRNESGEKIDSEEFINRFSTVSLSLRQRVLTHHSKLRSNENRRVQASKWPKAGDVVCGFELKSELGRGSFGRVFLARELQLRKRQVVVKIAQHGFHEAQLLAQVPHSGVVPIYSVGTDTDWGLTTQCMPFISRATLLDVIEAIHDEEQQPFRAKQIAEAARSLNCSDDEFMTLAEPEMATYRGTFADGVSAFGCLAANALNVTHERGIRHSDIKPSNILVDQFGCPVLIDFNLSSEPRTGDSSGGTVPYMAPEQLQQFRKVSSSPRSARGVTTAADVFSLGVCLFELLYGKHPFTPIPVTLDRNELVEFLISRQIKGPRKDVDLHSLIDPSLKEAIDRCLEIAPDSRPTAIQLATALQKTQSLRNRLRRMFRLHRGMAKATAGLVFGGALAIGVAAYLQPDNAQQEWELAVSATQSGNYSAAIDHLDELLRLDPENSQYLAARGNVKIQLHEFQKALSDLQAVYDVAPSWWLARRIAWCHTRLLNYDLAARWHRQLIEEFPEDATLHNNYGFILLQDLQLKKAIEHFSRAVEIRPDFATAWYNRADARFQYALRSGTPTPESVLEDLKKCEGHQITGEARLLRCRICVTTAVPDRLRLQDYIRGCNSVVPRSRVASDELLKDFWDERTRPILDRLKEDCVFTRPIRIISPSF